MSDRLAELLSQRASLQEQLAKLDREIAAEAARDKAAPKPVRFTPATIAPASPPKPTAPFPTETEAIMAEYRNEPGSIKNDVRKGCFLYVALAFAAVGAVIVILYFRLQQRH